ncbi:hypothetical protein SGRA_1305 [Saprospira grandis str. Lewin]|uniref:Uncharacterized protein n=1 Tax=Saprospira grandis (strain Lewin) TaxID=984262 RepID=H6L5C6_SAPGL|nr:hypothetical protein SGRA_1305 [Saprospira grandis str. Lewin]
MENYFCCSFFIFGASASLRSSALRFGARYSLGPAQAKPAWSGLRPPRRIARPAALRASRSQRPS